MHRFIFFMMALGPLIGLQFDEKMFDQPEFLQTFRRDPLLSKLFDPTAFEEGQQYRKEIVYNHEELLDSVKTLQNNDLVGDPLLRKYQDFGSISPSTLRFIKTAADIHRYFGPLSDKRVLHIGAGYGGVVRALSELESIGSYTLLQHSSVNRLAKLYLNSLGVYGIRYADDPSLLNFADYDLVIIDADFAGPYGTSFFVQNAVQQFHRGFVLKRGIASQFEAPISWLIANGKKGKLYPDLYHEENVRYCFLWRPQEEELPTAILEKAEIYPSNIMQPRIALTNGLIKKGLGHQLVTYFKTKWLARTTKTPMLVTPFILSECFQLSDEDHPFGPKFIFKGKTDYSKKDVISSASTLCTVPYQFASRYEYDRLRIKSPLVTVHWEDSGFRKLMRESLKLKTPVFEIHPPEASISIALHARKAVSRESYQLRSSQHPLKFSQNEWMVEQLKRVRRIFPKEHLYVYLFTDDENPAKVAVQLTQLWNDENAEFDWGKNNHLKPEQQLLSDFQSFKNFDCLIRPESNFSFIGGMLGRFKLEIWPTYCHYDTNDNLVIDQLGMQFGE